MRRFGGVFLLLVMCVPARLGAADDPAARPCVDGDNLRAMRPWIGRLLRDSVPRSPTLAGLAETLHGAAVVIHLDDDLDGRDGWDGRLRFVTNAGGCRYLRIDLRDTGPETSAALLAHELQHAVEVASSAVADRQGFARLFRGIGFEVPGASHPTFDTEAAVDAGRRAWAELTGRPLPDRRRRDGRITARRP